MPKGYPHWYYNSLGGIYETPKYPYIIRPNEGRFVVFEDCGTFYRYIGTYSALYLAKAQVKQKVNHKYFEQLK